MNRSFIALGLALSFAFPACATGGARKMNHLEVQGHRGARARLPENTLPAMQYAIDVGVDTLEMDLGVTKDGVLVLSHNQWLDPVVCRGPKGEVLRKPPLAEEHGRSRHLRTTLDRHASQTRHA
jgi:glycerophosphoryl diester phosphodiesterase